MSYDSDVDSDDRVLHDAPNSGIEWEEQPKFNLKYPEVFTKNRRNLGNIIINRMKTTGGTDIDWFIEHNGHFMIFELRQMIDNFMSISKAQMYAFEALYKKLGNCHFFLIGYEDIDFSKAEEHIWFLELGGWINNANNIRDQSTTQQIPKKYLLGKDVLHDITVNQLRSIIDTTWNDMK